MSNPPILEVLEPTLGETVGWMKKFAREGSESEEVHEVVRQICQDLVEGDYASECAAIYYWMRQNIRYMRDPPGVEYVQTPKRLLKTRAGDCDDMAVLIAAMLLVCGNPCRFVLAGFAPGGPPSHVFVEVRTPHGWHALDPVANRLSAQMLKDMKTRTTVDL